MDNNIEIKKTEKKKKKAKLDNKYIQLIVTSVLCLVLGFFSGRYYERKARMKAMSAMREQMETSVDGQTDSERPAGIMPGMGRGGGMPR